MSPSHRLALLLALCALGPAPQAIAVSVLKDRSLEEAPPPSAPGDVGSDSTPGPKPGWRKLPKTLLYYDAEGLLSWEAPLGRWEESDPARVRVKTIDGGTSANSRFAWTLERRTLWNSLKTKLLESQRTLRFFGPNGKELWSEDGADFISDGAPAVASQNGEVCLIALRRKDGWYAAVKTYIGNTPWELGPFPRIDALQITPSGRYGLIRWNEVDKIAVHSFLDISRQKREDVPSDRFRQGKSVIDEQGQAFSGTELAFSFSASSEAAQSRPKTP